MSANLIETATRVGRSRLHASPPQGQAEENIGKPDLPYVEIGKPQSVEGTLSEHATAKQFRDMSSTVNTGGPQRMRREVESRQGATRTKSRCLWGSQTGHSSLSSQECEAS